LGESIRGPLARLDLAHQTHAVLSADRGVVSMLPFELEPGESMVLIAGDADLSPFGHGREPEQAATSWKVLDEWLVERLDDNALTLDYAMLRRGDEPTSVSVPVVAIQEVLNDAHYDGPISLRYTFESELDVIGIGALRLVIEHPECCSIRVNNQLVAETDLPYWRDIRWRQVAIGHCLRRGENQIDVYYADFQYGDVRSVHDRARRYGTEIESIYLVGDFAIAAPAATDLQIVTPPDPTPAWPLRAIQPPFSLSTSRPLGLGDLVDQGLPFYAGRIAYSASFTLDAPPERPIWLEIERLSVPVIEVNVNGSAAGYLAWRPYRLAIGSHLCEGENIIELILHHSLRNLLGPHHDPEGEPDGIGPHNFRGSGDSWAEHLAHGEAIAGWRPSYAVTEYGLLGTVRLLQDEETHEGIDHA
jgi:hypothetical protein